jgi:hypothetical protein
MQLARHAHLLGLLRVERHPRGFSPSALQPVEHVVERSGEGDPL